jgi:hypothetical protein
MKYKITNMLSLEIDKRELKLVSIFDDFEGVIEKIVRDLNSIWKDMVPLPTTFKIELVSDDEYKADPGTMVLYENGEVIAKNESEVQEAMEAIGIESVYQRKAKESTSEIIAEMVREGYVKLYINQEGKTEVELTAKGREYSDDMPAPYKQIVDDIMKNTKTTSPSITRIKESVGGVVK